MPILDPILFANVEKLNIVLDLYFSKSSKQYVHRAGEVPEDVC